MCLLALVTLACGGGGGTPSTSSSSPPSSSGQTVVFKENEYTIDPAKSTLKPGSYTFQVQNLGQFPHDLHIATSDGSELGATTVMRTNQNASFKVTLKAGTYTIWCAVDAHRSLGMEGSITVA
jgi:plastocyanin